MRLRVRQVPFEGEDVGLHFGVAHLVLGGLVLDADLGPQVLQAPDVHVEPTRADCIPAGQGHAGAVAPGDVVSVTGYGLVLLFGMSGAPDLALTQALVETIVRVRASASRQSYSFFASVPLIALTALLISPM